MHNHSCNILRNNQQVCFVGVVVSSCSAGCFLIASLCGEDGYCFMYSKNSSAYYLLFRTDMKDFVSAAFVKQGSKVPDQVVTLSLVAVATSRGTRVVAAENYYESIILPCIVSNPWLSNLLLELF